MPFRFIHTADIHLDSPLRSLAMRDPDIANLIGGATRRCFENIVQLCLEEQVDALLIAGDLYDGNQESMQTALFFAQQMERLQETGIRVFMILGNHDMKSKVTKQLRLSLPENVCVFDKKTTVYEWAEKGVALHGVSFTQEQEFETLLPRYNKPTNGLINIGLMHTSLDGSDKGHDPYAPCKVKDLQAHGFHYWALGHIHKRHIIAESGCTIVMPGIPQGRHVNEHGSRSVTLTTIDDDGCVVQEERYPQVAAFARIPVDISTCADWQAILNITECSLQAAEQTIKAEYLVARLEITGKSLLASQLYRDQDLLLQEARRMGGSHTFIEKIQLGVQTQHLETKGSDINPVQELSVLMQHAIAEPGFTEKAGQEINDLRKLLKEEDWRDFFGKTDEDIATKAHDFSRQGCELILAHLEAEQGEDA